MALGVSFDGKLEEYLGGVVGGFEGDVLVEGGGGGPDEVAVDEGQLGESV